MLTHILVRFFRLDLSASQPTFAPMNQDLHHFPVWLGIAIPLILMAVIFDGVLKAIGMWKSARNNQIAWFICIAVFNTIGILPIIYLLCCQQDKNPPVLPNQAQ